jgi:hypothetical protein
MFKIPRVFLTGQDEPFKKTQSDMDMVTLAGGSQMFTQARLESILKLPGKCLKGGATDAV